MHFTLHLDKNQTIFAQIYTFYPTFGQKSLFILKNELPLPQVKIEENNGKSHWTETRMRRIKMGA